MLSRKREIPLRFHWCLQSFLLNEVPTDGRSSKRCRSPGPRPHCAICGKFRSDGIKHLVGVEQEPCQVWEEWATIALEEANDVHPALTLQLLHPTGDIALKLRLVYVIHTIYRWKFRFAWNIHFRNFMTAWRYAGHGSF